MISIVTPAFNAARTIRRTLDAMCRQKGQFEHLVYDGGSTDGTPDIVREYAGRYPVRLLRGVRACKAERLHPFRRRAVRRLPLCHGRRGRGHNRS